MTPSLRFALLASATLHGAAVVALPGLPAATPPKPTLEARLLPAAIPLPPPPAAAPSPVPARKPLPPAPTRLATAAPTPVTAPPDPPPAPAATAIPAPPAAPVATPSPVAALANPAPAASLEPPRYAAAYLANPPPAYPPAARRRGIQGTVTVEARIGPEGDAREVKLATSAGDASLDAAAMDAVRAWRFVPARRGDQAVEAWVRIPLVFRLN